MCHDAATASNFAVKQTQAANSVVLPRPPLHFVAAPISDRKILQISNLITVLALIASPLWVTQLFFSSDHGALTDFILVPVIVLVNLGMVLWVTSRDRALRQFMIMGLVLKIAAAGAFLWVVYGWYGGAADVSYYYAHGVQYAQMFREGSFTLPEGALGTTMTSVITALFMAVLGDSLAPSALAFAMLAYWGQYLMYRSFCIAYPRSHRMLAALLIFGLPSLQFWSASLGKDVLCLFFIAVTLYGLALVHHRLAPSAYILAGVGFVGVALIRPHVAALIAISAVVPYVASRSRTGISGFALRLASIPLVLAGTYYLYSATKNFVEMSDLSQAEVVMERVGRSNEGQGSTFGSESSPLARMATAPFLPFRPFPWEVHNLLSGAACAEGLALLIFCWRKRRTLYRRLREWRSDGFSGLLLIYVVAFSVVFSGAMTNFGLLARERCMMLPAFLMLFLSHAPAFKRTDPRLRSLSFARMS